MLKDWFPTCSAIGRWGNLYEVGQRPRKLGHRGHALEGHIGALALSPLSFLLPSLAVG
jgi:hypothetical protein